MADEKVTSYSEVTAPNANSVLYIITWPFGSASSHRISLTNFFGNIPTSIGASGNLTISGNTSLQNLSANNVTVQTVSTGSLVVNSNSITIANKFTPASSSIVEATAGKIFYDDNYLYVTISTGVIKRVALGSF